MPTDALYRLWDQGQRHLAAGRYIAARTDLQSSEALAWRNRDAASLARIYLPLLEARRQIRYLAAEGTILICPPTRSTTRQHQLLSRFQREPAGTILLYCPAHAALEKSAAQLAGSVHHAARHTGRALEALLLIERRSADFAHSDFHLASPADPTFAAGLPAHFTTDSATPVPPSTEPNPNFPLPAPASYVGNTPGLAALARESLLIAWEALALHWQHRHPPPKSPAKPDPWDELAWLRLALRIDPACEPITMRLIALAEAIERAT